MAIDQRTPHLNLPLPHANNLMRTEDVPRLRDAMAMLDQAVNDRPTLEDVQNAIMAVVGSAPGALDTLQEIAAALGNDANYAATITAQLATKLSAVPVATSVVLGGVKIGAGLVVAQDGTVSTTGAGASAGMQSFAEISMVPTQNGQKEFTPQGGYEAGQIELFLNGVLLYGGGDDYTASDGAKITLTDGVSTVDKLLLRKWYHIPLERAVNKTGDTMTGPLSVPANATGTQAPRVNEVVRKTGDTMTGALIVPAGATDNQVPRVSEVLKKAGDTVEGDLAFNDHNITSAVLKDCGEAFADVAALNSLDYRAGKIQRWAPATGAQALAITNWPPSGVFGEMMIEGVNLGAATITGPSIKWVKSDGTFVTTTSMNANHGATLQTAGIDFVVLWTRDGGATTYGKIVR